MKPPQTAERDAYGIQELADAYGVHRTTIYREIWDGRLSTFKLRGRTLVSHDAFIAWRNGMDKPKRGKGRGYGVGNRK